MSGGSRRWCFCCGRCGSRRFGPLRLLDNFVGIVEPAWNEFNLALVDDNGALICVKCGNNYLFWDLAAGTSLQIRVAYYYYYHRQAAEGHCEGA